MSETKRKNDPATYRKLSEPHASPEAASETISAFYEKVAALRKEHSIADVVIIVKDSVEYPDGKIGDIINIHQMGDSANGLPMAAYAYGVMQAVTAKG